MFEFSVFATACVVIAFLAKNIQNSLAQPKSKLQPIKIEREETRRPVPRHRRPY